MANWSGITATLAALARPRTLQPNLVVPSIANLDWHRLRHHAGVHAVVVDKDNCIAKPNEDDLANSDELRRAWAELLDTFGAENVVVVSNTAGDLRKDPLLIQAETVSRNLRVPVLVHRFPKPGQSCARQIAAHFLLPRSSSTALSSPASASSAPQTRPHSPSLAGQTIFSPLARSFLPSTRFSSPARITSNSSAPLRLLVIGDRLSTDMILSSRLSALRLPFSLPSNSSTPFWRRLRGGKVEVGSQGGKVECVGVLTTKLWGRDGAGTALMRLVERVVVRFMGTRSTADGEVRWEEYVKDHQAGSQRAEARAEQVVEPSLPSTSPSTPRQSGLSLSLPSLSTLRALPFSLTHSLQTLPSHLSSLVHSLPLQISSLTSRLLTRLFSALETHLPRLLARLHAPMSRVVRIYTDPTSLAPAPSPSTASSVQERGKGLVERAERRLDRWIDAAETTWDEAGRRIDSLEVERLGAKIAEARRAVRESAEGLRERVWRLKAGGQGRVER
ncbi:hypothetical protein Rt10032_c13g5075 [Rhodotorula toruloides]|uniref:Mitochondrial PGP phosphatase-domain containing protein n=1 Tax=Rhodotorula toruloides TaxID=5286 RepID=A0A511KL04_RHOTO|nr:hypothetical protein Rt10032_c13g5075 [Rhodotorula toruloides]